MKTVFDNTEIGNFKIKNRLFRSATWERLANSDGSLTKEIYDIYEELAIGGVGTIITGLTDISKENQALPNTMRLYSDTLIPEYKNLTDMVHQYNCRIISQLVIDDYIKIDDKTGEAIEKEIDDYTIVLNGKLFDGQIVKLN